MKLLHLAPLFALALAIEGFAMPTTLFVAPNGTADNPGTEAQPLSGLAAARDRIRALRQVENAAEPVTVVVAGGTYSLTEPVVFEPQDGQVRYVAKPGETPVFSGSRTIAGFTARPDGLLPHEMHSLRMTETRIIFRENEFWSDRW